MTKFSEIFPACRALLGLKSWQRILETNPASPDGFPDFLKQYGEPGYPWISGLACIELARHGADAAALPTPGDNISLNPTLQIIPVAWQNLLPLLVSRRKRDLAGIREGAEIILCWREPQSGEIRTKPAEAADLLAIKLVVENIDPLHAAGEAGVPVGAIDAVLRQAVYRGLLLSPPSVLRREGAAVGSDAGAGSATAGVFTLQWHLTQRCDLHCRHCYDRSRRSSFPYDRAIVLLDELRDFCRRRFIRGQISFSGGNPLLHPRFFDLYRAAAGHDFMLAILGNAADRQSIEKLVAIRMPVYYQVSLEGLASHNDHVRGAGNFRRTVDFLRLLTEMGVPNMVMLTLTRHNLDQVIPLARELEGVTGGFTFNRLALFGEGKSLELPTREEYLAFLETYAAALKHHPVLTLKDSLLNTLFERDGIPLFGGCAGHGCGAAFNFVSILPDGEVHACRKFPSPIGNVHAGSLEEIHNSEMARRYRRGSVACAGCTLNELCRGCPAVTASMGLDPFTAGDPFCTRTVNAGKHLGQATKKSGTSMIADPALNLEPSTGIEPVTY